MAEAAVLSLAANIFQMVEYGVGFVATAWKVWKSGQEGVAAFAGLEILSKNLRDVSGQLQGDLNFPSKADETSSHAMFELATECMKTTQEMIGTLDNIGLPSRGRKREAAKATFRLTWKMDDIKALQARLEGFRNQLTLNLVASLRSYATTSLENQDRILKELSRARLESDELQLKLDQMTNRHKGFGSTVVGYLAYRKDLLESSEIERSLRDSLISTVYDSDNLPANEPTAYDYGITENRRYSLQRQFLSNLSYDGMNDRAVTVAEAHQSTFRWIFEPVGEQERPWDNFRTWLESDHQLYWITGKAGSGKSTLMKFVSQPHQDAEISHRGVYSYPGERRCMEYLRRWSGDQPLLIACFYFWAAGSKTQTSKAGLFRTLLHQIVYQFPEVLPYASPKRWEALCLFNEDPKMVFEDELRDTLYRSIQHLRATTKICLFVDGLDEFDGDHGDLIGLFKRLAGTPSVKICVASRPWIVFEDALNNGPSLRLEDLTHNDIREYVMSRLGTDSNFSLFMKQEFHFADDLVSQIVRKSGGVFLWVNLVVSSLLDGMKYGDRISDLQRRLDSLPPDLEDLYDRILDNLDPRYFEHATQYFRIMAACQRPPSALLFLFADEDTPTFATGPIETNPTYSEPELRIEWMRRRVNSRCKGLIEVGRVTGNSLAHRSPTVQYLHKTVKDYVEKPEIQRRLLGGVKSPFDPHLRLCAANLAMYKVIKCNGWLEPGHAMESVLLCMRHASRVSTGNVPDMFQLLGELERATSGLSPPNRSWCVTTEPPEYEDIDLSRSIRAHEWEGNSFLSLAIKCEVVEYVKAKAPPGCIIQISSPQPSKQTRFSWRRMLRPSSNTNSLSEDYLSMERWQLLQDATPSPLPNGPIVSVLLEKGGDPNYACISMKTGCKTTVWIETLAVIIGVFSGDSWDPNRKATWLTIARHMLAHRARTDKKTIALAVDSLVHDRETMGLTRTDVMGILLDAFRSYKKDKAGLNFERLSDLYIIESNSLGRPAPILLYPVELA